MNTDKVLTTTEVRPNRFPSGVHKWSQRWLPALSMLMLGAGYESALPSKPEKTERGAVSLEQVLWFVAAGLSVAVVAGILWAQIRTQASTPINVPSAP
jgi:hypothetical protein